MVGFIGKPMGKWWMSWENPWENGDSIGKPMGKPIYTLVGGLEHGFYDFPFDVTGFG